MVEVHGYGFMLVNWPLERVKVEEVHRVALMVEMGLTRSLDVSHLSMRRSASAQGACYGSHHHPHAFFKVFVGEK